MDRLSQALAAGFNAPVVYIQLLNGLLVAPVGVRAVRFSRWQCGPTELVADGAERQRVLAATGFVGSPPVLPGS